MFLLNLGLLEFLGLFGAVSGLVVTLYLLSRSRRKLSVSTLRFWTEATQPVAARQHRRIQQPWSLLLQLLSLLLLLLAIAQLRLGSRETSSRDHVLVLDTSSWMAARSPNRATLLDEAKVRAKQFVRSLPQTDRVMVVRADGLASPATGMESDRDVIDKAIDDSRPAASALNVEQALSFADEVLSLNSRNPGEIAFVGAGRMAEYSEPVRSVSRLRVIPVSAPTENCGITRIGLRRSPEDGELWEVFVSIRNHGTATRRVPVVLQFGGAPIGSKVVDAAPGKSVESTWKFRTKAAGWIEARLLVNDALREDNRAILEIPALQQVSVAVYSAQPNLLRPALDSHPQVKAVFHAPSEYKPDSGAQIVILDRFAPRQLPVNSGVIWIEPPDQNLLFKVRSRVKGARIVRWEATHDLGSGLRSKDFRLASSEVFAPAAGDIPIAEVEGGPVIVARPSARSIVLGFHPGAGDTRFDVSTPLLMANILRWFEPAVFRSWELHGGSAGAIMIALDSDTKREDVQVLSETQALPFTIQGKTLRFFAGAPGDVRVLANGSEQVHSLSLPEVGDRIWTPPLSAKRGIPAGLARAFSRDVWQILAALGALGLLAEWLLYGRKRTPNIAASGGTAEPVLFRKAS